MTRSLQATLNIVTEWDEFLNYELFYGEGYPASVSRGSPEYIKIQQERFKKWREGKSAEK